MLAIILLHAAAMYAEEQPFMANTSFGIEGDFGITNALKRKGSLDFRPGLSFGGGFVFEKMFNNRTGIHSGLGYNYTIEKFSMGMGSSTTNNKFYMQQVNLPLYLITSFNAKNVSFNLLYGLNFGHIFYAKITTDDPAAELKGADILKYLNYNQIGAAAGFRFVFRIGEFTDFYAGVMGEFNATTLFSTSGNSNDVQHMYAARGIIGVLMRTNVFPMQENGW